MLARDGDAEVARGQLVTLEAVEVVVREPRTRADHGHVEPSAAQVAQQRRGAGLGQRDAQAGMLATQPRQCRRCQRGRRGGEGAQSHVSGEAVTQLGQVAHQRVDVAENTSRVLDDGSARGGDPHPAGVPGE
jgi:hypothetical protein